MTSNFDHTTSPSPAPENSTIDSFLDDLSESKQRLSRSIASMAAELKELRRRRADMEELRVQETLIRQEAEGKVRGLEEEMERLHRRLDERNESVNASNSVAERYLKELDLLRYQLTATQATANASAASAEAAQLQCFALAKELDEKSNSLKQHKERVQILAEKLRNLQKELQVRELSQKQLKVEVMRVEHEVMEAVAIARTNKDCESRKILDEVASKKFKMMDENLTAKDEETRSLKNELRTLYARSMLKTKEIESQMEKHNKADRDLKKRVLKLEIYLQEACAQSTMLQRMVERKDQATKELRDQLLTEHTAPSKVVEKRYFWESSSMKIFISVSVWILTVFSKW